MRRIGEGKMNKKELQEREDRWIDRHSINCIKCGELVDERDCIHAEDSEGEVCPKCSS